MRCNLLHSASSAATCCDVLVSTPNRLLYALHGGQLQLSLRWLIVDESDRLFSDTETDHSFRLQVSASSFPVKPALIFQLQEVFSLCSAASPRRLRCAFFSATFSYELEEWCKANLPQLMVVCVGARCLFRWTSSSFIFRNSTVDSVQQQLIFTGSEQGKVVALKTLLSSSFQPPVLIFVQVCFLVEDGQVDSLILQSKDRVHQLYQELRYLPLSIGLISSDVAEDDVTSWILILSATFICLLSASSIS